MTMDRRAMLAATLGTLALGACHGQTKAGLEGITLRVWRHKLAASRFMEAAGLPPPLSGDICRFAGRPDGAQRVFRRRSGLCVHEPDTTGLRAAFGRADKTGGDLRGDTHNGGILVNRGSSARRIEDLRGRTVTYVPGTNDHFYLLKLLDRHGLSIKDIQPVPLSALDANAAFQSGHVEACTTSNLPALQLEAMGGRWLSRDLAGSMRAIS
jgi:sulfonate transport system substrate-binding protein